MSIGGPVAGSTPHSILGISGSNTLAQFGPLSNGQVLVGSTGNAPVATTITGTVSRVIVTNGPGTITLSLPQDIATVSQVTFDSVIANSYTRGSAGTLLVGQSSGVNTTVGNSTATVNVVGSTINLSTSSLNTTGKILKVNRDGLSATGSDAGFEIEEATTVTGYFRSSSDRNSFVLKAPNTAGIATITPGSGGITLDQSSHNPLTLGTANGLSLSTQQLSLALSSGSTTGALNSTDWNTFNNKQPAGNYITDLTGDVIASGPGSVSATIAANAVTSSKFRQVAALSILGNPTGSTANVSDITGTNGKMLNINGGAMSFTHTPTLGSTGAVGKLTLSHQLGGAVTIVGYDSIGTTYNFNLPDTAGTAGQVLTSQGGGTNPMTWTTGMSNPMTFFGDMIYGGSSGTPTQLVGNSTTTRKYLNQIGNGSNAGTPVWGTIQDLDLPTITLSGAVTGSGSQGAITTAFRNGTALSVLGNPTNASAALSDIVGTANQVLRVNAAGTALAFGTIDLSAAVTGILPVANGGTGAATHTAKAVLLGNGTSAFGGAVGYDGTILTGNTGANPSFIHNPTLGATGFNTGSLRLVGATSGTTSVTVDPATGLYSFILPTSAGTAGQVLTSQGGSSPMTWTSVSSGVTSVDMTVPAFLSVTGNPITSSGTLAVTLSGTALPIANGGTGGTTATAAFDNLSPMNTQGDIIYRDGAGNAVRLGIGSTANVLRVVGGVPNWGTVSLGSAGAVSGVLTVPNGGTGNSVAPSNGQLLIGNGTGYTLATITAGTGISVTNGAGTVTISNTGSSSNDINLTTFTDTTDVRTNENITGFAFNNANVRSFFAVASVFITGSNLFAEFNLRGIQRASDWMLSYDYTGDDTTVSFNITTAGQIQFSKATTASFASTKISFRALTTSVF